MSNNVSEGPERLLLERGNEYLQRKVDDFQLLTWLHELGPWDVIAHFTWRDRKLPVHRSGCVYDRGASRFNRYQGKLLGWRVLGASEWTAASGVRRFMDALPGVSYFYSVEKNPSRDGHHVHALWGDCKAVFRTEQWSRWVKLHGRARIEPVRSAEDVASYASKYVMKIPSWWNVKLRWHRLQNLRAVPFQLERGPSVALVTPLPVPSSSL